MSLGLPAHVAPGAVRRSFVSAQHTVAFTLLTVAVLTALVFQSAQPDSLLWLSSVALLPAVALLLVAKRVRIILWMVSYLLVGGVGTYLYVLALVSQTIPIHNSEGFSFLIVKVALLMVGGTTLGTWSGIAGALGGYVTAELAVGLALVNVGVPWHFDVPTFATLLATVIIIPLIAAKNRRQLRVMPRLQRAAHDEHLAMIRYRIEEKAAALVHDTVLNHLAAIADSKTDHLDPKLETHIRQDVESLVGEDWLSETSEALDYRARVDWQHSGLFTAVHEGRLLGLDIATTGDLAAVGRLDREASIALGLAVKQCLVNVAKHADTLQAEIAVYFADDTVSVMVVDNGSGFIEASTGADRLGLRSSVRRRIELVNGQVNVWSTPGRGTSIMISIPAGQREDSLLEADEPVAI